MMNYAPKEQRPASCIGAFLLSGLVYPGFGLVSQAKPRGSHRWRYLRILENLFLIDESIDEATWSQIFSVGWQILQLGLVTYRYNQIQPTSDYHEMSFLAGI